MKGAMAILLLKKEQGDDLRNHRQVCLMHVATKMTTAIITDRMVRNIKDNHLLEEGQEGGRTERSTQRQIQKLIWSVRQAETDGSRLTVA
eukprot:2780754-Rhodomonas_salina.1